MTPAERLQTLQHGLAALRALEAQRRAALPPPERPDAPGLRELRDVAALADHLAMELDLDGLTPDEVLARDASLSMGGLAGDIAFLEALAADAGAGKPYRPEAPLPDAVAAALRALAALLRRYDAREFMPPDSYFGIGDRET